MIKHLNGFGNPLGRPSSCTPELVQRIADSLALGLTNEEAAAVNDVSVDALNVYLKDTTFNIAVNKARSQRVAKRIERIEEGGFGWQGTAWILERWAPKRFSRPEVQLNVQNNVTNVTNVVAVVQQNLPAAAALVAQANQARGLLNEGNTP